MTTAHVGRLALLARDSDSLECADHQALRDEGTYLAPCLAMLLQVGDTMAEHFLTVPPELNHQETVVAARFLLPVVDVLGRVCPEVADELRARVAAGERVGVVVGFGGATVVPLTSWAPLWSQGGPLEREAGAALARVA